MSERSKAMDFARIFHGFRGILIRFHLYVPIRRRH